MLKFVRLTNFLLNPNDINRIIIQPNKYHIYFTTKKVDGFSWSIAGFGFGRILSEVSEIEVCETQHPNDYKIVSNWINKNS
jgi:hypothetical protein